MRRKESEQITRNGFLFRPAGKSRGSILILSLWALLFLSTMSISLAYGVRQQITLALRLEHRSNLGKIAEAGVRRGILEVMKDTEWSYDAFSDSWASNEMFEALRVGAGICTVGYRMPDSVGTHEIFWYGIQDEERKININSAAVEVLDRIFQLAGGLDSEAALDLAYSVVDWRDADPFYGHPQYGAEDAYYEKLRKPYEAKDTAFEVLEELLLVKDMTPDLFKRLQGYLTVHGSGAVNINTAPLRNLEALGLGSSVVEKIQQFRLGADGTAGTDDDNAFANASTVTSQLSQAVSLSPGEISELSNAVSAGWIGTAARVFQIRSQAQLSTVRNVMHYASCIFERDTTGDGETIGRVLVWQEGVSSI